MLGVKNRVRKNSIMHGVWYEIIASVYDYIKLYRYTINIIKREYITQKKCFQKKEITVTQTFLHCMSERALE